MISVISFSISLHIFAMLWLEETKKEELQCL